MSYVPDLVGEKCGEKSDTYVSTSVRLKKIPAPDKQ